MRCCGKDFPSLRAWITHKLNQHPVQIEQFGQALGDDPTLANDESARKIVLRQLFSLDEMGDTMTKEQEERIAKLDEDNKIMRGRLAALGQPYMPGDQLTPPSEDRVATIENVLNEQAPVLEALKAALEQLTSQADQDPEPTHPTGLCQEETCEICVAQGHALLETGRQSLSDEIDDALALSAGEDVRLRVAQLVQRGQALRSQRDQVVEIVAK